MNRITRSAALFTFTATTCGLLHAQPTPDKMSLDQLVQYALKHSPELHIAQIDLDTQQATTIIQRAKFAVGLNYTGKHEVGGNETGNSITLTKPFAGGVSLTSSTGITASSGAGNDSTYFSVGLSKKLLGTDSSVLDTRKGIEDSLADELIALNRVNLLKRQLLSRVSAAFYKTIRDLQSKTIQERRLERARRNLEMTIERGKPLDIITARIQIPENELAVVQTERAIANDLQNLKVLVGMPVEETLAISDDFAFQLQNTDLEEDIAYALENHEEFLNNRLQHRKLDGDCQIAKTELWPDLELKGTHRADGETDGFNPGGSAAEQTITLSLAWAIGRRADKARYRQALNKISRNARDYFILKQKRLVLLSDLSRQLDEKATSVALQQQRIDLVTRQVELYRDRYENGEIDVLEFIRSQNDLESSKVELIRHQTEYMERLANYSFQTGR